MCVSSIHTSKMRPISCPAGMQEAASAASKGAPRAEGFEFDLIGSQGAWVASSTLLLGLASGQLVAVNLQVDGGSMKRIKVCPCAMLYPHMSRLCPCS